MRTRPGRVCASLARGKKLAAPLLQNSQPRARRCSRDALFRKKAKEAESRWIVVSSLLLRRPSSVSPYVNGSTGESYRAACLADSCSKLVYRSRPNRSAGIIHQIYNDLTFVGDHTGDSHLPSRGRPFVGADRPFVFLVLLRGALYASRRLLLARPSSYELSRFAADARRLASFIRATPRSPCGPIM